MLKDAIHEINHHNASGLSFEELYRRVASEASIVQLTLCVRRRVPSWCHFRTFDHTVSLALSALSPRRLRLISSSQSFPPPPPPSPPRPGNRSAYNMVLHRHGRALYDGLVATVTEHLREIAAAVDAVQGDHFLTELEGRWQDHTKSMQMIRDILMYMDRVYVQPNGLKPVHDLGLALWRDHVIRSPSIKGRVQGAVLGAINRERNGELIDQRLVRAVTSMLMDLGEDVYVQDFEEPFVAITVEFYRSEAQTFLASSDCADYLRRSQERLNEEHTRVKEYLNARTERCVVVQVEEELLTRQMGHVLGMASSGLEAMLRDDKHEQLALVYTLYSRVQGGLTTVKEMMGEHVRGEVRMRGPKFLGTVNIYFGTRSTKVRIEAGVPERFVAPFWNENCTSGLMISSQILSEGASVHNWAPTGRAVLTTKKASRKSITF